MNCLLDLFYLKREQEWKERENKYLREFKKANMRAEEFIKQTKELEENFHQEQTSWHIKEHDYIQTITELQNELHQNEVVTQQYKIYERNFQQDRQQLSEIQGHIEELKDKTERQAREIDRLNMENEKYLNSIINLRKKIKVDISRKKKVSI